jgi:hypothetical protein
MNTWTNDQLDALGRADEIAIAPRRTDGRLGRPRPIWIVRLGDDLYIRSYTGPAGSWFRTVRQSGRATINAAGEHREDVSVAEATDVDRAAVDAAYRTKYGRSSYVDAMVTDTAADTTLRFIPDHQENR